MTQLNKASEIGELLSAELATITIANGYLTDIGLTVFRGKRNVEDDQAPCCALIEGEDRVADEGPTQAVIDCDYAAVAYMPCDPDNPNDAAHLAIKDIKKLFFSKGARMGNQVKKISYKGRDIGPRADGKPLVMAVVHFTIRFSETLADA